MSISQVHRGRSNAFARRLGRGLRRRLGFEVMEGRCLLSAVTLQFSPLSLPGTQDTTQIGLTTVIGGQQAASSAIVEGGYIDLGGLPSQSMNDYVPAVTAGAGGAGVGISFGGAITELFANDQFQLPRTDTSLSVHAGFDTGGGGFGMRPVVISPSNDFSVGMPRVNPGRSLVTNQDRGGQEGGIVQIEKILAGDKRFDSEQVAVSIRIGDTRDEAPVQANPPTLSERLLASPANSDDRVPALASAASTELAVSLDEPVKRASDLISPTASSVITGELARAMVFEMAGGEPAWVRPVVSGDQIKSLAPSDGQQAPRAELAPLSPAAAHQAALRTSGSRIRLNGNLVEFPLPAADSISWNGAPELQSVSQHANGETATFRGGFATFNAPHLPVAEVFAELGGSEQPPVRSSSEDDSQTGPLVAGSVIALLMLERAAARYKSRSERQFLTVVAGPPRI
jgi:hypothetical protein